MTGSDLQRQAPTVTHDGHVVGLWRRLPARDDLEAITQVVRPGQTVLDLGCGAGRLAHPLVDMGCEVTAVDHAAEMLAQVRGCETIEAPIEGLYLGRTFDVVLLASNLVNTLDDGQRGAFLQTCERHIGFDGRVVIQRLDPAWAMTAQPFETERDGFTYTFTDVEADGQILSGTVRYRTADLDVTERFRLGVLDDPAFDDVLAEEGLRVWRWLDGRGMWAECCRPGSIRKGPPRLPPGAGTRP